MKLDPSTKRPQPKITISEETTHITGPLRANGYVDYVAALNRRCSEGVTRENNAAIPFCRALGPKNIDKKIRKRFFELLGIPELSEDGTYLVAFDEFLPQYTGSRSSTGEAPEYPSLLEEATKQFDRVQRSPWSEAEHPAVGALLEKNEQPLQLVVEGSQRPRFYSPAVPIEGDSLSSCCLAPAIMALREAVRQLRARAMLRLAQGRIPDAWLDALACHRLARLAGQGPLVLDALISAAFEGFASACTVVLAQHADVTPEWAKLWQSELRNLPARQSMREYWDYGDRLWALADITNIALHGCQEPPEIDLGIPLTAELLEYVGQSKAQVRARRLFSDDPRIDWDEALRYFNGRYDRVVAALGEPTGAQRQETLERLIGDAQRLYEQAMEQASNCDSLPPDMTPKVIARRFGDLLWQGTFCTVRSALIIEFQSDVYAAFPVLALALAGYRHDYGGYPKTLAELTPKYIAEIPKDPFSDGDLHYKLEGDGYLLYSVGPNGKDDGGRNYWHEHFNDESADDSATEEEQAWDDIAIRTPSKQNETI